MNIQSILELLEKDARLTARDLADILSEDEEDVSAAIRQMEQDKIICGYHTVINYNKVLRDQKVMAYIEIDIAPQRDKGYDYTANLIANYPEVDSMYLITGNSDFICMITGKTMFEVARFVSDKIACIEDVRSTNTLFVLKQYKESGVLTGAGKPDLVEDRLVVSA
ncbi:MAG: Lrp/AsnC family transcriptional regulator [Erysipelotrichaceae bacterium]|nr:Lrp/AsnC family transcriptional regulator [Erysipelotrichaceae bacterium]